MINIKDYATAQKQCIAFIPVILNLSKGPSEPFFVSISIKFCLKNIST